jgi:conjugal transfer pilus assembly protein TraW
MSERLFPASCGMALTAVAVSLARCTVPAAAGAATSTIGRTWPIAEPDALAEIEGRVATLPRNLAPKFGPRSRWTAMQAAQLAPTTAARARSVVPFYTLEMDVALPDGRVLYPKGFTFNPLTYVTLSQRLLIVHASELRWALKMAAPTDWIILAGGAGANPDPVALGKLAGRPLFLLEERVKDRLGLTTAPVIVRQVGKALQLSEIVPPKLVEAAR